MKRVFVFIEMDAPYSFSLGCDCHDRAVVEWNVAIWLDNGFAEETNGALRADAGEIGSGKSSLATNGVALLTSELLIDGLAGFRIASHRIR
jgi:hypothetical protein